MLFQKKVNLNIFVIKMHNIINYKPFIILGYKAKKLLVISYAVKNPFCINFLNKFAFIVLFVGKLY